MNEVRFAAVLQAQGLTANAKAWRATVADVTPARAAAFAAEDGIVITTPGDEPIDLALWRATFDAGFVPVRGAEAGHDFFLRSDLVTDLSQLGGRARGTVAMSSLGNNGRFANQLFQYAYLKFYALRHACEVRASNAWEGEEYFSLKEEAIAPNVLPELRYYAFDNDDLILWEMDTPPADVDLWGYFQETPLCWAPHRALLSRFYTVRSELDKPISAAWSDLTENGHRPLIAAHIRRGDYVTLHTQGLPWYRPAPEAWSAAWMAEIAKSAQQPVFYVATDEPAVLAAFKQFNARSAADLSVAGVSPAFLDFEIMRRAAHLAIANSSFSRMAAILAPHKITTVIPDFERQQMVSYKSWIDRAFWGRFEGPEKAAPGYGYAPEARLARSFMIRSDRGQLALAASALAGIWTETEARMKSVWADNQNLNNALKTLRNEQFRFSEQANLWVRERDAQIAQLVAERNEFEALAAMATEPPPEPTPVLPVDLVRRVATRAALSVVLAADRTLGAVSPRARAGFAPMIAHLRARRIDAFLRHCRNLALCRRIPAAQPLSAAAEVVQSPYAAPPDAPVDLRHGWAVMPYTVLSRAERSALNDADFAILSDATIPVAAVEALCALLAAEPRLKSLRIGDGDKAVRIARAELVRDIIDKKTNLLSELEQPFHACAVVDPRFIGNPSNWPANRPANALAPNAPFWNLDPIGGSERLANAYRPSEQQSDKPHALVVMPWMTLGGSEIVFLDVLSHLMTRWRFTIITTLPNDHALRAQFRAITEDIVHAGDVFDQERTAALIMALATSRGAAAIISSNAALMHERAAEISASLPQVKLYDILHNDLPGGHIEEAAKASTAFTRHIAVSQRVGRALRDRGVVPQRIAVIANGVDTDLFAPSDIGRAAVRAALGISDDVLLLTFVGRLSAEKRPSLAIAIASRVNAALPTRLVIIGEGPLEAEVHMLADAHGSLVTFRPPMNREAVRDIYRAADFLVLPSTIEGMPLSALEALSTGCPVAATDVGELAAVIKQGENGFLVPARTPLDLAEKLISAFPNRAPMRQTARSSFMTSGRTKAAMVQSYESVLSEEISAAAQK